jgi:hypothetical protein
VLGGRLTGCLRWKNAWASVSIALRVSPTLNSRHIHFKTKYELAKACFESLIRALEGLDFELFVILDGCPKPFEKIFRENVEGHNLKIVNVGGVGNSATFLLQTLILSDLSSSDYVYFAEDDYFTVKEWTTEETFKLAKELKCISALELAIKINDAIENGLVEAPYKIPVHTWTKLLAQKILRDPLARSTSKNPVKTLGTKRGIKLLKSKLTRESY